MARVIDFHSHILPGADHGSRNVETTEKQMMLFEKAGTEAVVATSHFYPNAESAEHFLKRRNHAAEKLRAITRDGFPTVYLGAEVLLCAGMHRMENVEKLAIEGTDVILLELPFTAFGSEILEAAKGIRALGLTPVMAHIDRYPAEVTAPFLRAGFKAQLNATAFGGLFPLNKWKEKIEDGTVVALGSDLHGANPKGVKVFTHARKKLGHYEEDIFARTEALMKGAIPCNK